MEEHILFPFHLEHLYFIKIEVQQIKKYKTCIKKDLQIEYLL